MRKFLCAALLWLITACSVSDDKVLVPGIIPNETKEKQIIKVMPSNVIGAVERIYLPPIKAPFLSRIDTGATTSSIDAEDVRDFERDGARWLTFTVVNRESGEKYTFEKPLVKRVRIKRIGEQERRPIVEMDVKMGGETFKAESTIAERGNFEYQVLVGRNILSGRAIVDVSLMNTLK